MSALSIQPTYPIFTDIDGQPLEDGFVWIGQANLDPQVNPINVFWNAALTIPAGQPIRTLGGYPSNSGTPARLYVNSDYSIRVLDKNGSVVYSAPAATERYNGSVISSVTADQVTFAHDQTYQQGTVGLALQFSVNIKNAPFNAVGDGVANDTVAIQNAINHCSSVGGGVVFAPAGTYRVSTQITVPSNVAVIGDGIGITLFSATPAMTAFQAVFYGDGSNTMRFENFSILGNTDGTLGAGSGIHCKTGLGNQIRNVFISNTTQAGIRLEEQNNAWVDSCWLQSNGRTGYTGNHGIMIYSVLGSTVANYNIKITNNKVNNAFRKGITDYAPNADIYDILIDGNTVESCGLGGIYIGTPQGRDIRITNNFVTGCYVNIQYGPGTNSIIDSNNVQSATGDFGIGFYDSTNLVVSNNTVVNSYISGIDTVIVPGTRNSQVTISGNIVHNSNRSVAPFGPGIYVEDCDNAIVTGNIVYDDSGSIATTHGVVDGSGNVNCQIAANTVLNVSSSNYLIQSTTGMLQDVTYGQTQDFLSGVKVAQNSVTLANGTNNNVAMPVRTGVLRVTGPTGIYSITGITNGLLGRQLTLVNDTNFALTLEINDAGSSVGNRFLLTGGVDKVIAAYGSVTLMYVTVQGNNFWVDV